MNDKIGIITFNRSLNYGSAIQAWALSKTTQKLIKTKVEIIDYIPNHYERMYTLFLPPTSKKRLKNNILHLLMLSFFLRRKRDFSEFWITKLPLSKRTYNSKDDISAFTQNYNTIICGSDQIWNPRAIDFDMNYLLPGLDGLKKISYAVSIGRANLEEVSEQDYIRKCIEDFKYLSMRESSGALKLKRFLKNKRSVEVVLDPTLLLEKTEYKEIASKKDVKVPYIFFYSVQMGREIINVVKEVSKQLKMPVYTLISGNGNFTIFKERDEIRIWKNDVGPCGFISLLHNAEFVVTDSFHGTALSIKFEKEFISVNTRISEGTLKNDERIMNILNLLNLNNRYVASNEIGSFNYREKIDYGKVSSRLNEEIQKSIDYLKHALVD